MANKDSKANSGRHHEGAKDPKKPIVDNWNDIPFMGDVESSRKLNMLGSASLTINADGSYDFSGKIPRKFGEGDRQTNGTPFDYRLDLVFGVKSAEGSTLFFPHSTVFGDAHSDHYVWNTQGNNHTVKDNFASFVKAHDWHASYHTSAILPPTPQAPSGGGGGGTSAGDVIGDVMKGLGVVASIIAFF
jgi:hypothetical protein